MPAKTHDWMRRYLRRSAALVPPTGNGLPVGTWILESKLFSRDIKRMGIIVNENRYPSTHGDPAHDTYDIILSDGELNQWGPHSFRIAFMEDVRKAEGLSATEDAKRAFREVVRFGEGHGRKERLEAALRDMFNEGHPLFCIQTPEGLVTIPTVQFVDVEY